MDSDPRDVAIDQLEQLGLSAYAARTFVALLQLRTGTATDVSEVIDVPRTRVYDAVNELHDRGLAHIRDTSPKEFYAISGETAGRQFERETRERTDRLVAALDSLGTTDRHHEQRGIWSVQGGAAISNVVGELVTAAEEELVYVSSRPSVEGTVLDELQTATERGVEVTLSWPNAEVEREFSESVSALGVLDPSLGFDDDSAGRLLLADDRRLLVSAYPDADDPEDGDRETAVWVTGETNSLITVLERLLR